MNRLTRHPAAGRLVCLLLAALLFLPSMAARAEENPVSVSAEALAQELIDGQLAVQKDPWARAILESGARDASVADGTLTFTLCGFDPNVKALGPYAKAADPAAWRKAMFANIMEHRLVVTVPLAEDGTVSKKAAARFGQTVKSAAKTARNGMSGKDVTAALKDMLFPVPTEARKPTGADLMTVTSSFAAEIGAHPEAFPCEKPEEWAPMFLLQRNQRLVMKDGPHAIRLTWDGIDPSTLLTLSFDAASGEMAAQPKAERVTPDGLPSLWARKLADTAVALRGRRFTRQAAVFDIADLAAGKLPDEYAAYFARYQPAGTYAQLAAGYEQLPDAAAQPMPKTGTVTANAPKGRVVAVRVPSEGRATYVQLRDADTGVIQSDAFILPGGSVRMKVAEGEYVVQYASGATWYGLDLLFGPMGTYSASDPISVAKTPWKLVAGSAQDGVTLHPAAAGDFAATEDKSVWVEGTADIPFAPGTYPENNPVLPGISSTTGLPASGERFTPILMVLDNAEDAYPHWGVSQADIIFQIPNAGSGVTKLMALFADHYPEQAGPVRSGRASMVPLALSFNAAFAFAGPPAVTGGNVDLEALLRSNRMVSTHRSYNLLRSDDFKERFEGTGSHNLSCHVKVIHENLVAKDVAFEERPFLFTDEPRTNGEKARVIRVLHRGESHDSPSNSASRAVFAYDEATGQYTRTNSSGLYVDRTTGEQVTFSNVIVLRVRMNWEQNYVYLRRHLVGSGAIEIFQDGRYVRGGWVRTGIDSRLILLDADGQELKLKRGKTFIVVTNDVTDVVYSE